jgi:hypothetical protein
MWSCDIQTVLERGCRCSGQTLAAVALFWLCRVPSSRLKRCSI